MPTAGHTRNAVLTILAILWAGPQAISCAFAFGYSFYSPAVRADYANAPLPTSPGPFWLYLVSLLVFVMSLGSMVLVIPLLIAGSREMRGRAGVRSSRRRAWPAAAGATLAVQVLLWIAFVRHGFAGYPSWPALALAVGFTASGAALITVILGSPASVGPLTGTPGVSGPGQA